jgi:hypothetical protein
MAKITEVQINDLVKRVRQSNAEDKMFSMLVGWFKSNALTEGNSTYASKRRSQGAAFFAAVECCMEDEPVNTEII